MGSTRDAAKQLTLDGREVAHDDVVREHEAKLELERQEAEGYDALTRREERGAGKCPDAKAGGPTTRSGARSS